MHMSLQIDPVARTLRLSVKDLCTEIAGGGSLNLLPLSETRRDLGWEIHQKHQSQARRQNPAYRQEQAIGHDLCPYELSLELIPQTNLRGIFDCDYSRVILVVDEAHNLYSRAREYYSSSLERNCLKNLLYRLSSSG